MARNTAVLLLLLLGLKEQGEHVGTTKKPVADGIRPAVEKASKHGRSFMMRCVSLAYPPAAAKQSKQATCGEGATAVCWSDCSWAVVVVALLLYEYNERVDHTAGVSSY